MRKYTLVINPGATSTKVAIYDGENEVFTENISHPIEEIQQFHEVADQFDYRKDVIMQKVHEKGYKDDEIAIVMGRGGLTRPCESGTYRVNELMRKECIEGIQGKHACNLGALISDSIAKEIGLECAYIADPGIVDERPAYAKITGHTEFDLDPSHEGVIWHCLNQKMTGKLYARELGKHYEDLNLIIAHMGGGVSVGIHEHGRCVEVNRALCGLGAFSPTRSGSINASKLIEVCFSGKYDMAKVKKMVTAEGALCRTSAPTTPTRWRNALWPATRNANCWSTPSAIRCRWRSAVWPLWSKARSTPSSSRAVLPTASPGWHRLPSRSTG